MEELLAFSGASKMLNVHPKTFRLWDKNGVLQAVRIGVKKYVGIKEMTSRNLSIKNMYKDQSI